MSDREGRGYRSIAAEIARGIALGDFGEDGKLPAERKLAGLFGVSRVTIRAALDEAESQGLISRRHGSGTFAMRQNSVELDANSLCFAFELIGKPISENPYVSMSIDGIGKASLRLGMKFDLLPIPFGKTLLEHLKENPGLLPNAKALIIKWSEGQRESVEWLQERGHQVVAMGPAGGVPNLSYADIDNPEGGRLAARHLLSLGRSRIAYVDGPLSDSSVRETLSGVKAACLEAGKPFIPELLRESTPWSKKSGFEAMESLLAGKTRFDAVIFRGDMASLGALEALKKGGVRIPEEISFLMYDDFPWVQKVCVPKLSSIRQPFDELAERAAEMAMDSVRSGLRKAQTALLAPELIVRDSCGGGRGLRKNVRKGASI